MIYFPKTNRDISYEANKDLSSLANELETDKGTADPKNLSWGHIFTEHFCWGYTEVYKKYMDDFRESEVKFLEVGICDIRFKYASPKMWLKYFKNIDLYCIDNFWGSSYVSEIHNIELINSMGVNFIYGDQYNSSDWDLLEKIIDSNTIDFMVEDGSHYPEHMMYTLWRSISLMKTGGYYFMEDIQNPDTSRNFWGYDNADIFISLNNFLNGDKLNTQYLDQEKCTDIQNHFEIIDLVLDKNKLNYLGIFKRK